MSFRWIQVIDGGGEVIPPDQEPTATEAAANASKKTPGSFTVQKLGLNVVQGGKYQFAFAYLFEDPENPSETLEGPRSSNFTFNLDTPDLTREVTNLVVTPGLLAYGVKWDPIDKNLPANKWFIDAQIYESLTGAFAGEEYLVWNGTGNSATILVSDTNNRWIRVYTRDADFHRKGVTYGPFKATDPIIVDVTGPGNVSSVTTNGGLDTTGIVGFNGYADISWPAVTGGGIRGYRIRFRPITTPESSYSYADSPGTGTSYRLAGLGAGLVYEIAVATYDEYNNTSSSYIAGTNVTVGGTPYIASTVDVSGFFRAKANPGDADSTAFKFGYGIETGKRGLLFNASNYWHIDSNQSALFKVGGPTANYLLWDGAKLTIDGDINAKGGTFSGNIFMSNPSGGKGSAIYSGTIDPATGNLTGNGFALNSTGLKVANGTNSVTLSAATGTITANAGSIANWNLSATTLSKNNIILDSAGQIQVGSTAAQSVYLKSSGSFVMWAGNNTPDANAKFRVGVDGTLYATGAVFGTGTTVDGYATTGTVTGLNTRLTTAEGTVSTLGTNVTTLSTSVGTISSGLATKNTTFVGGTAPTANRVGDIWIDTNSGNELKTWTGSVWTTRRDTTFAKTTDLATKLNASASIIQSTTDNKITANASGLEIFSGSANSGLKFTGTGLFGYKNGSPTFTITSDGDATFYGALSAATGSFTGRLFVNNDTGYIDTAGVKSVNGIDVTSLVVKAIGFRSTTDSGWTTTCYPWTEGLFSLGSSSYSWYRLYMQDDAYFANGTTYQITSTGDSFMNGYAVSGGFGVYSHWAPRSDNTYDLGGWSLSSTGIQQNKRWRQIYSNNSTITTSDSRLKTDISNSELGLTFINKLRPVTYRWIEGSREPVFEDKEVNHIGIDGVSVEKTDVVKTQKISGKDEDGNDIYESISIPGKRRHAGFLAQEVKQVLDELEVEDFGGWVSDNIEDPEAIQSLRYEQFVAPLTKAVQELSDMVESLQQEINILKGI